MVDRQARGRDEDREEGSRHDRKEGERECNSVTGWRRMAGRMRKELAEEQQRMECEKWEGGGRHTKQDMNTKTIKLVNLFYEHTKKLSLTHVSAVRVWSGG